jgi:hypothetical protein
LFCGFVSNGKKLIRIVVVVLLSLLGLILWYFLGPRHGSLSRHAVHIPCFGAFHAASAP